MNDSKILFNIHPLSRGNNNITDAMLSGEIGFEIEIRNGTSIYREILNYEQADVLRLAITSSIENYWEFKKLQGKN